MVRRAILDRPELADDDEALPASQPFIAPSDQPAARWRGAGGRWLVWVARAVAWAVLVLIGYRGVVAIFDSSTRDDIAGSAAPSQQFPVSLAEAYALQFGSVYLDFSPATAAERSQELARFLPADGNPQLGWNGAGTQQVRAEQVAGVTVSGRHTATVTLLVRLGDAKLIDLGVPIYAAHGGMSVAGEPAILPGPAKAVPPRAGQPAADQAAENALRSELPAFFRAYAAGDRTTLARFSWHGAGIAGLGGTVSFGGLDAVYAPSGGARRRITVTVTWKLASAGPKPAGTARAGAALQMTYAMAVIRQGASWDVQSIGPATQDLGPP